MSAMDQEISENVWFVWSKHHTVETSPHRTDGQGKIVLLAFGCWKAELCKMLEHSDDTLSANVVNLFPKRYQISEDQQDEKNIFQKYHEKAGIHSFPTMYNTL